MTTTQDARPPLRWPRGLLALVATLFAVGVLSRVLPLFDHGGRLLRQWPTEDGYFMLTIARNFALGEGFSVTGGELPTNGTQPLATLLWSAAFFLVGGARKAGVGLVLALEVLIAVAAAGGVYVLGRRALMARKHGREIALLAAAVWFASPLVVPHTMNGLESGLYVALGVWVMALFIEPPAMDARPWSAGRALGMGVLLGLVFWARNDAVFFILGASLAYLYAGYRCGLLVLKIRLSRVVLFGATSVAVAAPWLWFNVSEFGHVVPISGRSELLLGGFGGSLDEVFPVLTEYLSGVLPIPESIQGHPVIVAMSVFGVVVAFAVVLVLWRHARLPERTLTVFSATYGLGLVAFYGLFFGGEWFMARYLFPLSPVLTLLFVGVAWFVWMRLSPGVHQLGGVVFSLGLVILVAGLHLRTYERGAEHQHFQVVDWVSQHVDEDTYVGAVQTGTLGFFHDKTINLDGKVNPAAYEALAEARIAEYVAQSRIEVIADWTGILDWMQMDPLREEFLIEVHAPEKNLVVLRRRPSLAEQDGRGEGRADDEEKPADASPEQH